MIHLLAVHAAAVQTVTVLDVALLLVVLYSIVRGFLEGVISEFGLLLALVVGIVVASHYASDVGTPFARIGVSRGMRPVVGYVAVMAVIWVAARLITRIARRGARLLMLGWVDRLAGAGFGLLRGLLIIVVATFLIVHFRVAPLRADAQRSTLVRSVAPTYPSLNRLLPQPLQKGALAP